MIIVVHLWKQALIEAFGHADTQTHPRPTKRSLATEQEGNPASARYYQLLDAATAAGMRMGPP